jgi:small conductance mechanosensitive channel
MMQQHAGGSAVELEKRAATIGDILRKTARTVVWAIAIMMALREVGLDIRPILAGAGILGLAVGFGAQNLVRDVITGMFMLLENQVRVNDVAVINGTGGLVEEINLRTTVLRGQDGAVHIFPNGSITTLSNLTREFSHYVFDIRLSYQVDTDRAIGAVREVAEQLQAEEPYRSLILAPLEVLGLDQFTESAVIIRARIKTMPIQQWTVGREMNRRFKKKFEELGITFAAPRMNVTMNFSDAASQIALKDAVRQVLRDELEARSVKAPPD